MEPATAIIQFIGIVLFSASIPGDPGLHAVMPRIGHVHKSEYHVLPKHDSDKNLAEVGLQKIENHVSVIMYRTADRLYKTGPWKGDGALANGWNYLELNGERVRFLSNGANKTPMQPPAGLPRIGASSSCQIIQQSKTLNADYLPPYRGAVAVVDIPEGTLAACDSSARRDTRLMVETNGVLVITATKKFEQPKALVLKGDAVVFVANIPPYALIHNTDLTMGDPHWMAYNAMLDGPCGTAPQSDKDLLIAACDPTQLGESYQRAQKDPPIDLRAIDSGCSNSQWP